jgi:hypothetical protein
MESTTTHLTPTFENCEEKAARVMRWAAESEDTLKVTFTVSRAFEHGVLQQNTAAFLRLLLEESFGGKESELELEPAELKQFLTDAFKNTYLYLLTPQTFITDFLCLGTDTFHINLKMLGRLAAFTDYPYFSEMLEEWFRAEGKTIDAENRKQKLRQFLGDVDRTVAKYSTVAEVEAYLLPLYEFVGETTLTRETVEIFLEDKGLPAPQTDKKNEYTAGELSALLQQSFLASEPALQNERSEEIPQYDTFLQELREIGVVLPPPHPQQISEERQVLPPIEMFIGKKLRHKCLEKIFHENNAEYDRMVAMLNSIEDYSQAELNLNTLLQIHKVDGDSKVAVRLKEALHMRFGISSIQELTQ